MSIDWAAVGAIGQWAGALATTAAVVFALKVARDAAAVRVKVEAEIGFHVVEESMGPPVVIISATNVGQRRAELLSTGAVLPNKMHMTWLTQASGAVGKALEEFGDGAIMHAEPITFRYYFVTIRVQVQVEGVLG